MCFPLNRILQNTLKNELLVFYIYTYSVDYSNTIYTFPYNIVFRFSNIAKLQVAALRFPCQKAYLKKTKNCQIDSSVPVHKFERAATVV